MQAYLRNEISPIVCRRARRPARPATRVQVEIRRQLCTWVVPFTVIKLGDGTWIVNQVDLTAAGNPAPALRARRASRTRPPPPE